MDIEYTKIEVIWTIKCPKHKKRVDVWPTCHECHYCESIIPSGRPYIICKWKKKKERK
jgi:ribosomal protein L34E